MNINKRKSKTIAKLRDKEYRDAFVSEHIDTGLPFQIRALRKQRRWTQAELAGHSGIEYYQETISRLEDPNRPGLTLETLKELASAFDVGLVVRFAPFSELAEWEFNLAPDSLEVPSFDQDSYFIETEVLTGLEPEDQTVISPAQASDTIAECHNMNVADDYDDGFKTASNCY